jgi:hypothetical protein
MDKAMMRFGVRQFTIRYRANKPDGRPMLIVQDDHGTAYLFSGQALQVRMRGARPCDRLVGRLRATADWQPVSPGTPLSLDALRDLAREWGEPYGEQPSERHVARRGRR